MGGQECLHFFRIGLSGCRIGGGSEQLLVKAARRVHRENRDVVHARAPFLAAGWQEAQRHAAHGRRRIRLKRHAPASAKRPTTGIRPGLKTAAFDKPAACPLLSNQPVTQTPLAWLRRKPAWVPLASSKAAIIRSWVSRDGDSQPPTPANAPPTLSITAAIAPSRMGTPTLVAWAALNQNGFMFLVEFR